MTALLTDNLPLLAGAPNGIKKLRELILELAVRGKLVEQDASDEPASELLKRIAAEKARLVAEGKIRKQKPLTKIAEEEKPFELPAGWEWSQLGQISSDVQYGFTASANHQSGEPLLLRITDIQNDGVNWGTVPGCDISPAGIAGYELKDGDIVIARTGGTIGKSYLVSGLTHSAVFASYLIRIGRLDSICPDFTKVFLGSQFYWKQLYANSMGTGQPNVNGTALKGLQIPLAPLAEQHRIVAKVDELMALCDRLEAQQADAARAHAQLVQALLGSLTQASDAADFAASWQRLAEHFHTLFSTEPSIDALKQTLLQLAVMGKLVPQDPTDEPASELLKRIQAEKQRLVAEGKLKKQNPVSVVTEDEKPFHLPGGWEWARLGGLTELVTSGSRDWAQYYSDDGAVFVRMGNLSRRSYDLRRQNIQFVTPPEDGEGSRTKLEAGDFLISITGEVGLLGLIPEDFGEAYINQHVCLVRFSSQIRNRYFPEFLRSPLAYEQYEAPQRGIKNSFRLGDITEMVVPVPPEAEQHRIVAKVDQLMALCDQLKTQLSQARQLNQQLASTLVEQALVDGHKVAATAIDQGKARTLLAAEIVQKLHGEKRMGRVKLQKIISLAEHVARLKEIQSDEQRYAAGPHDPALMNQVAQGLRASQWFEELALEAEVGKRYEYRPLAQAGAHRPAYEALWSAQQRRQVSELIELMRLWDTPRCERVATLYSAWNDLLIEGREATEAAILHEVLHGWNDSKLKFTEAQWQAELTEMKKYSFLIPTGFGKRTTGGVLSLPGFE